MAVLNEPGWEPGALYEDQGDSADVPWELSNCPPGLEYLCQVDQLLVHQQLEILEAISGFETNNRYEIKNSLGQRVYFAAEDTDCLSRLICGSSRAFSLSIFDNSQHEVMKITRPLRCTACCCPCCLQIVEVQSPPGRVIGYIEQIWDMCRPRFVVQDAAGATVVAIEGPLCTCSIFGGDVEFEVVSSDGDVKLGNISKQWAGFLKEAFTDADNFGITFPMDLDVKVKATLLAATFLIDFMYFERTKKVKTH